MPAPSLSRRIAGLVSHVYPKPSTGYRVLLYHSIGDSRQGLEAAFSVSERSFAEQVQALGDLGCEFASFGEVATHSARTFRLAVTFDDGYADNLTAAAPVLAKRGIPFTVFVITDFVRNEEKGYLTPSQLKDLASIPGAAIGAHGKSHVPLAGCQPEDSMRELRESRDYLGELLGREVSVMSLPHGSFDERVLAQCRQAGYSAVGNSIFGMNPGGKVFVNRTCMMARDGLDELRLKVQGAWDWYGVYQRGRKWIDR